MIAFDDVLITGLAVERTQQSSTAPGLRYMHLTLSARPTAEWGEMFIAERRFPRHSMWREAWVEGDAIVVDCVPEEIEQYHLRDLKEDVANTNQTYRGYLRRVEEAQQREQSERDVEASRLEDLKGRLQF